MYAHCQNLDHPNSVCVHLYPPSIPHWIKSFSIARSDGMDPIYLPIPISVLCGIFAPRVEVL
jgi:hypothetical protein